LISIGIMTSLDCKTPPLIILNSSTKVENTLVTFRFLVTLSNLCFLWSFEPKLFEWMIKMKEIIINWRVLYLVAANRNSFSFVLCSVSSILISYNISQGKRYSVSKLSIYSLIL
jgi:hypothetical protein